MNQILDIDFQTILQSVIIVIGTLIIARLFQVILKRQLQNSNRANLKDPTRLKFFSHVITALIYLVGFSNALFITGKFQALSSSLIAGAGLLTVAIGLASQNALSNIISGLFIVIFRPFRVNDRLLIKDNIQGIVEDITLRHTIIRDLNNRFVVIPNTTMNSENIVNYTLSGEFVRKNFDIYISYDSDVQRIKQLIQKLISNNPLFLDVRNDEQIKSEKPIVTVNLSELGEKGIRLTTEVTSATIAGVNQIINASLDILLKEIPLNGGDFIRHKDYTKASESYQ